MTVSLFSCRQRPSPALYALVFYCGRQTLNTLGAEVPKASAGGLGGAQTELGV